MRELESRGILTRGEDHMEVTDAMLNELRSHIEDTPKIVIILYDEHTPGHYTVKVALQNAATSPTEIGGPDPEWEAHHKRLVQNFDPSLVAPTVVVVYPAATTSIFLSPLPWAPVAEARSHMKTLEV